MKSFKRKRPLSAELTAALETLGEEGAYLATTPEGGIACCFAVRSSVSLHCLCQ